MITKRLILLLPIILLLCLSCKDNSSAPAVENYKITKSIISPEHYIPINSDNKYKYEIIAKKTKKQSGIVSDFKSIIDVSITGKYNNIFVYTLDTNWTNYFTIGKTYHNSSNLSGVSAGNEDMDYGVLYWINNASETHINLWIDSSYKSTLTFDNEVYECVVIEEKSTYGFGRGITYYAKGIGAIKYIYKYEDEYLKILSEMNLVSCDIK